MTWWRRLRHRDRLERELDAELRYHVDRLVEDYVASGVPEAEARRMARLEFGSEQALKEWCRDARGTHLVQDAFDDARFSARLLVKESWFSIAAIGALGLGIAVTAMAFTLIEGYNLRGLPVPHADRLLYVGLVDPSGRERGASYREYEQWQSARGFGAIGAFAGADVTVGEPGRAADSVDGAYVSDNAFTILGEQPFLGRGFAPNDDRPGASPVVLLGHDLWQTQYDADPHVVGRVMTINGVHATVIGVMREGFEFPYRQEIWLPLALRPGFGSDPDASLGVFGRLADGVQRDQARDELASLLMHGPLEGRAHDSHSRPILIRFGLQQIGGLKEQQPPLAALVAALCVLLIACANVANLLLARSAARGREMAIRASIGATRGRLVRQLMVESVMLSIAAGALGLWLSRLGVHFVVNAFGRNIPYWMRFTVDGPVIALVALLSLLCSLCFGLGPAMVVSGTDPGTLTNDGGRAGVPPRVRRWTQRLLAIELAVSVTLMAGAGLLGRSFFAVYQEDRVIDPAGVLTMELALPDAKYPTPDRRAAAYRQLDARVADQASAPFASLASARPFVGAPAQQVSLSDGAAVPENRPSTVIVAIGRRYFDALQVPVLRGRAFTATSDSAGGSTAIVNERFEEVFFPGRDAIGQVIRLDGNEKKKTAPSPWLTIVGVVPTIRQSIASGARPVVYLPLGSHTAAGMSLVVGRVSDPRGFVAALRQQIAGIDPDITLFNVRPLKELLDDSRLQPRLIATVIATFAAVALLLSVVGLYAFTAYALLQRRHEIGVRMALGAQAAQVVGLMVKRGIRPLLIGLPIGLLGAVGAGRVLRGLLIQTSPTDSVTLLFMAGLLVGVSVIACYLPARKAASTDPLIVLRND